MHLAELEEILKEGQRLGASDLLLVAGSPPCVYVDDQLQRLDVDALRSSDIERLVLTILNEAQRRCLQERQDVDLSFDVPAVGRFRANVHQQRGGLAAAFRYIRKTVPSIEELNLPEILHELAVRPHGLILITGATGQGKSTTLAAVINHINQMAAKHIITLEDPIEYLFTNHKSLIEQREIGLDSPSFASALRHVLRQKPDVILVGEMRDQETMATAITAAETGHLVMATLHTQSAAQAIERIVDSFDGRQQQQIRLQLAHTLQAVVAQVLFKDRERCGMIPACEVLVATSAVRRAIRDNDTHLIPGIIETGAKYGMQTLDRAMGEWVRQGRISKEAAMLRAVSTQALQRESGGVAPRAAQVAST